MNQNELDKAKATVLYGLVFIAGLLATGQWMLFTRQAGITLGSSIAVDWGVLAVFWGGIIAGVVLAANWSDYFRRVVVTGGIYLFLMPIVFQVLGKIASVPVFANSVAWYIVWIVSLAVFLPASFLIGVTLPVLTEQLAIRQRATNLRTIFLCYGSGVLAGLLLCQLIWFQTGGLFRTFHVMSALSIFLGITLRFLKIENVTLTNKRFTCQNLPKGKLFWTTAFYLLATQLFLLTSVEIFKLVLGPFSSTTTIVYFSVLVVWLFGLWISRDYRLPHYVIFFVQLSSLFFFFVSFQFFMTKYAVLVPEFSDLAITTFQLKFILILALIGIAFLLNGIFIGNLMQLGGKDLATEGGVLIVLGVGAHLAAAALLKFLLLPHMAYGSVLTIGAAVLVLAILAQGPSRAILHACSLLLLYGVFVLQSKVWEEKFLFLGYTTFQSYRLLQDQRDVLGGVRFYKDHSNVVAITKLDGKSYYNLNGEIRGPSEGHADRMLASLAALYSPDVENALVLGVNGGAAVGVASQLFKEVEAVDSKAAVIKSLKQMWMFNLDLNSRKNISLFQQDEMSYLRSHDKTYSLILSTISNPATSEGSRIYTVDFFRDVKERLKPAGVFVTYIDSKVSDLGFQVLLNSLAQVFDYCGAHAVEASHFALVCSQESLQIREVQLIAKNPELKRYFKENRLMNPEWIVYGLINADIFKALQITRNSTAINTIDMPFLESESMAYNPLPMVLTRKRLTNTLGLESLAGVVTTPRWKVESVPLMIYLETLLKRNEIPANWLRLLSREDDGYLMRLSEGRRTYLQNLENEVQSAEGHFYLGSRAFSKQDFSKALKHFEKAIQFGYTHPRVFYLTGLCQEELGNYAVAEDSYLKELAIDPTNVSVRLAIGRIAIAKRQYRDALALFNSIRPYSETRQSQRSLYKGLALEGLGKYLDAQQEFKNASQYFQNQDAHRSLGRVMKKIAFNP